MREIGIRACVVRVPTCAVVAMVLGLVSMQQTAAQAPPAAVPDAVIELWEQTWTLNANGSSVYHDKRHVQLNSDRAYGEFGDPRITYDADTEKLEIITARTRLPNGKYVELPEYGHVVVGPDASAGWPAFTGLRQYLLVMSGIEPGCVVEVEYQITSQPGRRPFLAADLRIDDRFPIKERTVTVSVPAGVQVRALLTGLPEDKGGSNGRPNSWTFRDLPASPDEPQAPRWQERCPRLMFTTADLASNWLKGRHAQLDAAADKSELIARLAQEWTKDHGSASDKLRALQEKLAAQFNFVEFPVDWRPARIRPASEVLLSNYGLPEEAAAVLLALARAAELPVMPGMLVHDAVWNADVPQDGMVAAYVVLLVAGPAGDVVAHDAGSGAHAVTMDSGDPPEIWDPRRGRIVHDGAWAGYTLLPVPDVLMPRVKLAPWLTSDESRLQATGKLTLSDDGNFAGTLTLRATGLFVNSEGLRSSDAQKGRLSAVLAHLVPDAKVESVTVKTLTVGEFEATAQVKSSKPLTKANERYLVRLAQDGPLLADVPLPLGPSRRRLPVHVAGPCIGHLQLTLEWPEKWQVEAAPAELAQVAGDWGALEQSVSRDGHSLTLVQRIQIAQGELPAADFLALRAPLNELRSEYTRTLVLKP